MSAILKIRIPFYRRKTNGGTDGLATFYLTEAPRYLPSLNQTVLITHTDVPLTSGLKTKLNNLSTNTVSAIFQSFEENLTPESIQQTDGFSNFLILKYNDLSFSTSQFGGDCRGYIEYDVNPATYNVLKPIESAVIVNESIPFDLNDGYNTITNKIITGETYPNYILKGSFVKRTDTNTIFANLLKSLNLPVSDEEMKKYTRSDLGTLVATNGTLFDTIIDGTKYNWVPHTTSGATTNTLVVHPTTGHTGEYYGTVLQTIGSYEYSNNKSILPVLNDLFLLYEIPNSAYGEIIDGKSIKFTLPYYTGTTNNVIDEKLGFYTYGTGVTNMEIYGTYNKKNLGTTNLDKILSEIDLSVKDLGIRPDLTTSTYESNVVLLFSDNIKAPQGSNLNSWGSGHSDVIDGSRVFNTAGAGVEKATYDHNLDECVGFVALDKGFVVITHPKVVDSYFTQVFGGVITKSATGSTYSANKNYNVNNITSTGTTRSRVRTDANRMLVTYDESDNIVWDSTQFIYSPLSGTVEATGTTSNLNYISYNTEKSLNIVCLASSDEFFKSTNDTAKELLTVDISEDFSNFKSEDQNLYPIIITQVGIHDAEGNLLAVCKPTQPIKKYWYDVVSFNVKIRL
jgi:hypothetical protein